MNTNTDLHTVSLGGSNGRGFCKAAATPSQPWTTLPPHLQSLDKWAAGATWTNRMFTIMDKKLQINPDTNLSTRWRCYGQWSWRSRIDFDSVVIVSNSKEKFTMFVCGWMFFIGNTKNIAAPPNPIKSQSIDNATPSLFPCMTILTQCPPICCWSAALQIKFVQQNWIDQMQRESWWSRVCKVSRP